MSSDAARGAVLSGPHASATPPGTTPGRSVPLTRLGYVDSLRALAALYVFASHMMLQVWWLALPGGALGLYVAFFRYGHQAVSVFIVLSGYSLMLPVARNGFRLPWGTWRFYWRRARRILPPYYLAMGVSLLLIWLLIGQKTGAPWDTTLPVTPRILVEHLLLVQDFSRVAPTGINYVLWSVAMECQIYLLFPLLVVFWRRYHPLFALSVVVALAFFVAMALIPTWIGQAPGYGSVAFAPQFVGLFAMGMFAATLTEAGAPLWTKLRDRGLWDALTALGFILVALSFPGQREFLLDLVTGLTVMVGLLACSRPGRNPLRAALEWRPLVWMGGFSYSLYLIHAPLIQVLWQYVISPLRLSDFAAYLALLALGVPLVLTLAWVFWYLCERPFLNSRPRSTQLSWLFSRPETVTRDGPHM